MVPFAGYEMPVQYANGILKEHLHVRAAAGLFDVSHMGQFDIRSRSGRAADAARALESVVPVDLLGLATGRQRYALLTNEQGGIRDDLMIATNGRPDSDRRQCGVQGRRRDLSARERSGENARSNASTIAPCWRCKARWRRLCSPRSFPACAGCASWMCAPSSCWRADCIVSRSGYTGEDGFEISVPAAVAEAVARELLKHPHVAMIGLGARDSLRLEAGLCLYGSDLDTDDHAGRSGA